MGVPLYMDIQVFEINKCRPLMDTAVEIWAANATGVYSGVVSKMNGNENDTANLENQALRGVQITEKDGSVGFETIVPGHYTGRAVHIHRLSKFHQLMVPLANEFSCNSLEYFQKRQQYYIWRHYRTCRPAVH